MLLKELREKKGISIYGLAKLSGVSQPTIRSIENGEKSPTVRTLEKLALAMNVKVIELIKEEVS